MKLEKLFRNRVVRNAGYMVAGKIIQMVCSLIVGMLTARYLGPANYGLINYAGAYTAFFTALSTLGINSVLVKDIIDHPADGGMVLGTAMGMQAISSFLSACSITCIVCFVDMGETETIWVVVLSSIGLIFHVSDTFRYWFQSKLESKVTAGMTLIAYLIASAYKIILLMTSKNVLYFASVTSIEYICFGGLMFWQYRKHQGSKLRFSWTYAKELLSRSCHFILPGLMVAIYGQTDKLMLKQMIGQDEVGFYSTAVAICNMWCFILSAIIESVYPTIMEAARQRDQELFRKRNLQLYTIVFYLSACVSLFILLLAEPIVGILYGEKYLPAVIPLRIVTWYTAFSYLGVARNAWIVSQNKQCYLLKIYVAAALSNVMLNLLLIPKYGTAGAAFASLLAQIITTMVVPFFIRELRPNAMMMLEAMNPVRLVSTLRSIRGR